jgi:histidinol phosphatase-like PHP family hydrolase
MAALRNRELSELLCLGAEEPSRTDQQRRALRRAGRAALRWSEEAAAIVEAGRSLTDLRAVGPWLARIIAEWLAAPPRIPEPPPIRRGFLTGTEVAATLERMRTAPPIRGDLQTHTLGSDGTASVRAMAEAAAARGLAYLAITDHSQGLKIAGGMNEAELARQGDEIRALNDELGPRHSGFRILRAVEMNLAPNGAGDLAPAFLAGLDLVLGAFHSRLRTTDDQTDRYLAALDNPSLHVLAHPRGRIFNVRLGLTADWARVFARARDRDRAVEIDAYPDRQDLDVELLRLARESGARISIGSDAHATDQLAALEYGITAARLADIAPERILNCMAVEELIAWTRSLGGAGPTARRTRVRGRRS